MQYSDAQKSDAVNFWDGRRQNRRVNEVTVLNWHRELIDRVETMLKKNLFLLLIIALALAGCKSGPSPTATFKTYFEAQQKKDIAAMKQTLSKTSLTMMEASAKEQGTTLDKMIQSQLDNPSSKIDKMPETRNEKITGDNATVELHNEEANRWDTMYFVKEDGAWKIALDKTVEEMLRKNGA